MKVNALICLVSVVIMLVIMNEFVKMRNSHLMLQQLDTMKECTALQLTLAVHMAPPICSTNQLWVSMGEALRQPKHIRVQWEEQRIVEQAVVILDYFHKVASATALLLIPETLLF